MDKPPGVPQREWEQIEARTVLELLHGLALVFAFSVCLVVALGGWAFVVTFPVGLWAGRKVGMKFARRREELMRKWRPFDRL